jgi:RimJ/RimL family protein N-acetyltransferase
MTFACETPPSGVALARANQFTRLVPELTTDRLRLLAPGVSDFDAYCSVVCTERGQYVGGPMSREDAWYDFIQLSSGWMLHGHGGWRVTEAGCDETIGFVVLGFEPDDREVELGYLLLAAAEGQGFASEAVVAVRDWAFATYHWHSLVSYIDADNIRSANLAQRLGAERDPRAETEIASQHPGVCVYRHLRQS